MKTLVVDDELVSRSKLQALLKRYGPCDAAEHAEVALRMLQEAAEIGSPYGLVTIDINMPDIDGHELLRSLRKWEQAHQNMTDGHTVRVLMVTAMRNPKDVLSCFSEGADWYLAKPVRPESLDDAMQRIGIPLPKTAQTVAAPCVTQEGDGLMDLPAAESVCVDGVDREFLNDYLDSTSTKLQELEGTVLELESRPGDKSLADNVMRVLHSLKGEAGMIGLLDAQKVFHDTETIVKTRGGDSESVDLVLEVTDWMMAVMRQFLNPQSHGPIPESDAGQPVCACKASGPRVELPDPAMVNCDDLVDDFWSDYAETAKSKLRDLEALTNTIRGGTLTKEAKQSAILTLNVLKGEAGMIGLEEVQSGLQQIELLAKNEKLPPKELAELLGQTRDWMLRVLKDVGHKRATV